MKEMKAEKCLGEFIRESCQQLHLQNSQKSPKPKGRNKKTAQLGKTSHIRRKGFEVMRWFFRRIHHRSVKETLVSESRRSRFYYNYAW